MSTYKGRFIEGRHQCTVTEEGQELALVYDCQDTYPHYLLQLSVLLAKLLKINRVYECAPSALSLQLEKESGHWHD